MNIENLFRTATAQIKKSVFEPCIPLERHKLELIEKLKTEAGLTKNEATEVVNLFFSEMANALPFPITV